MWALPTSDISCSPQGSLLTTQSEQQEVWRCLGVAELSVLLELSSDQECA